jgi:hypothetical protein
MYLHAVWEVPVSPDDGPALEGGIAFQQIGKLAKWNKNQKTGAFTTDLTRCR